ncbi:MAG TPA: aminoglycoside phosphotransferase family protein [Candidatus Limnocylindrales bacterium]
MTGPALPIDEAELRRTILAGHGIKPVELAIETGGADAAACAVRATASDGSRWFVKLRPAVRPAAILVPRFLRARGLSQVVASIPPRSGEPWLRIGSWSVLVFPFVDAPSAMDAGMAPDGWRRLGAFAARLHAVALPGDLLAMLDAEDFRPRMTAVARDLERRLAGLAMDDLDPLSAAVRDRWLAERGTIRHLVERSEALAARIREREARRELQERVLCHADLHAANVLAGADGSVSIIDWDELLLAPRERDLMFVRDSPIAHRVTAAEADAFEAGYGPGSTHPDALLLAWYRVDWAVQDLTTWASEALRGGPADGVARARARSFFEGLFRPGDEVDTALRADARAAID